MAPDVVLRLQRTPAHRRLVGVDDDPRALRVARIRARFGPGALPLPRFVRALPLPAVGILRDGVEVWTQGPDGARVAGDAPIREALGIERADDVVARHADAIAWTGLGNVAMNRGSVAFSDGTLTARVDESGDLAAGRTYTCVAVHAGGRVAVEGVRFRPGKDADRWLAETAERSAEPRLAVSGQPLVLDGRVVDPYANGAVAREYPDLRHLLRFAWVGGRDLGLDRLLADDHLCEAAVRGEPVALPLDGLSIPDVETALRDKSYTACASPPGERGQYRIEGGRLHVVFLEAIYNHHVMAVRATEPDVLHDLVIGGWSCNAGVTLRDLAADLAAAGFTGAVLMDQGGDAVLVERPRGVRIPSSLGRKRWAGLMLYRSAPDGSRAGYGCDVATIDDDGEDVRAHLGAG